MKNNIISETKKGVNDILCTPHEVRLAAEMGARYLKGHLAAEIQMRRMDKNTANRIYAAGQQLVRVGEMMQAANVHLPELQEWLENAKEIRTGIVEPKLI